MRRAGIAATLLFVLAGCSSGSSLDQQQQAWEEDQRELACKSIQRLHPGSLERSWIADGDPLTGETYRATLRDGPYTCTERAFARYYEEWLVEDFPDSPKGQAGETAAPARP